MEDETVCEVLNTEDKTPMTLSIKWHEDIISIVVLRSGIAPLTGQTTISKLCESAPGKTREDALGLIKNELTGKEKDVQFSLKDSKLIWKKKVWKRGTIDLHPVDSDIFLGDLSLRWLKKYQTLLDSSKKLEENNEILEKRTQQLTTQLNEVDRAKISMEDALYKQFLLVLNSKKRKIRELEERLKQKSEAPKPSVYEESTDDSEDELEESRKKRKKETDDIDVLPVASTSKRFSKSPLKPSPDSDEEIVLRYDESQQDDNKLNLTAEDPEDDLFSQ